MVKSHFANQICHQFVPPHFSQIFSKRIFQFPSVGRSRCHRQDCNDTNSQVHQSRHHGHPSAFVPYLLGAQRRRIRGSGQMIHIMS